jgi:hypothetical protein
MMSHVCRPAFLILGPLLTLFIPTAVEAAPHPGMMGMQGLRGGPAMLPGSFMLMASPVANNPFMSLTLSMQGRYRPSYSLMPSGGGYSGMGKNSSSYGMPTTNPNLYTSGITPQTYGNPYGSYGTGPDTTQASGGDPLSGVTDKEGKLDWPQVLHVLPFGPKVDTLRQQIDAQARELHHQAATGKVDPRVLREMSRDVDTLRELLTDKGDSLPVSYQAVRDARQFVQKVQDALKPAQ